MSKQYNVGHYEVIDRIEKRHFWFRARNELLKLVIKRFLRKQTTSPSPSLLEVGCGTGRVMGALQSVGCTVTGMDINRKALDYAKNNTTGVLIRKSFLSYSPEKLYDAVGMFDVLEHVQEDASFLEKARKVLAKNGYLFLTVPAGEKYWTQLDTAAGHLRRYEPDTLIAQLAKVGFRVIWWSYWGVLTLPLFSLKRTNSSKILTGNHLDEYLSIPKEPFNTILFWIMNIEHKLLFRIRWKTGATLLVVAKRD